MGHTHLKDIETYITCTNNRRKKKTVLVHYLHGCCFSPTPRTFLKAIKNGNFLTWPGLNNQTLLKYLPPSISTTLKHLDKDLKNLQLTKQVKYELEIEEDKYFYPDIDTVKTHEFCTTIIPLNNNKKGFSGLT